MVLYSLLRSNLATDTGALAISGAIPAIWIIVHWVKRNRVDWISLLGMFGLAIALVVTILSGRDSLSLKLYHPAVAGTIGAIFLFSVVIRKPLLITFFTSFKFGDLQRFNQPLVRKKITIVTAVIGVVLLIDTLIQVVMALINGHVPNRIPSNNTSFVGYIVCYCEVVYAAKKIEWSNCYTWISECPSQAKCWTLSEYVKCG